VDVVARTSVGVAAMRAKESTRPDRWFDDPWAAPLVEAAGWVGEDLPDADAVGDPVWRAIVRSTVVRTRWIDSVLGASTAPQVVLLGAGLDSRAWRLDWPAGTMVWELDRPEVLDVKAAVVTGPPACDRRPVAVDLLDDWPAALAAAGHDPAVPTTWVAEGLLVYFDDAGVDRLLRRVTALSPAGSRLVLTLRVSDRALPHLADVWRSRAPADPVAWMAGHGWDATAEAWSELAAEWGRPHWRSSSTKPGFVDALRTIDP
jgi:methyltransferase (TIGR00027 family)